MRFLIVQSDAGGGRGNRGRSLYWFLTTFAGRRAVRIVATKDLDPRRPITTEYLLLGMPSDLSEEKLRGIRYRRAMLYDYSERPQAQWKEGSEAFLRSLTNTYLKAWVPPGWDPTLCWGTLPIRRYLKLPLYLHLLRALPGQYDLNDAGRRYDASFIGSATGPYEPTETGELYNQRIQWLREMRQASERYTFWGGLLAQHSPPNVLQKIDDLQSILYPKKRVSFGKYFYRMLQSKVVLAPTGNVCWSYRHYEAIYAGATLVSSDFRNIRTLIPLPLQNMVHVVGRDSVLPALENALQMRRDNPGIAEESLRFLERYLHDGDYSRKKPALMDMFMQQIQA